MSKGLKITLIVVSIVLVIVLASFSVYFFWPWNKDFFDEANVEFKIPGLDTSFCPQGFTRIEGRNKYLISGYMSDNSASRVYVVDGESGNIEKYFMLQYGEDRTFAGHAGGICSAGSTIWIASEGRCYRFLLTGVDNVQNGEKVTIIDDFDALCGADYIFADGGYLWVGEFYKKGKYETDENHHISVANGQTNHSIVYGFQISENNKYGLLSQIPGKAMSVRDLVQGIQINVDGKIIVSTSYGLNDSVIYKYDSVLSHEANDTYRVGLYEIPIWYLDDEVLLSSRTIPAMSEEIVINNDLVYILFESGCRKNRTFVRKKMNNVYSLPISSI